MPITSLFKPEKRLIMSIHIGSVSDEEFLSFYERLFKDPRFDRSYNHLVDLRQTESNARSSEVLREFAEFAQKQYENTAASPKIAVVAPNDVSFGLARMYELFSGTIPWDFVVFRSMDAALAWLGLPGDLMDGFSKAR